MVNQGLLTYNQKDEIEITTSTTKRPGDDPDGAAPKSKAKAKIQPTRAPEQDRKSRAGASGARATKTKQCATKTKQCDTKTKQCARAKSQEISQRTIIRNNTRRNEEQETKRPRRSSSLETVFHPENPSNPGMRTIAKQGRQMLRRSVTPSPVTPGTAVTPAPHRPLLPIIQNKNDSQIIDVANGNKLPGDEDSGR
jgi:hypothetical protein